MLEGSVTGKYYVVLKLLHGFVFHDMKKNLKDFKWNIWVEAEYDPSVGKMTNLCTCEEKKKLVICKIRKSGYSFVVGLSFSFYFYMFLYFLSIL